MADSLTTRREFLHRVPYFTELPDDLLRELAAAAIEQRYARGQVIFTEGEPCAGFHVVARGEVRIYKLSPQGREQVLQQAGPGNTYNEVAVWDGGPNPASAMAATDAVIWIIPRERMHRLALARPELAWALLESIAQRTRHLVQVVEDLALRSVKSRVARLLLTEAERSADEDELRRDQMITQAEMAARLGTVREMIGRALRDLADVGLIEFDRHRIVILDREGLIEVSDG
jgi:CRP/FNR family cyclic AMP-dependent transcriptional regulator